MPKKSPVPRSPQLDMAGDLGVAFVNTTGAQAKNRQQGVTSYSELLAWGLAVEVISSSEAERLGRLAAEQPEAAVEVWERAKALRSALFRLFLAAMKSEELPQGDLDLLNEAIERSLPKLRLVSASPGLTTGWAGNENDLERVLWPAVYAASQLLLSLEGQPHVRQCAAAGCRLFFVDRSKSARRKWCVRQLCGHRAKSLRYYRRRGRAQRMKYLDTVLGTGRRRRRSSASK